MRKGFLAVAAALSLVGCTNAGRMPEWSARPQHYYGQRPYEPPLSYVPEPAPAWPEPRRYPAVPPPSAPAPDETQLAPPPQGRAATSGPSPEPADPSCGWWDVCNLWTGT